MSIARRSFLTTLFGAFSARQVLSKGFDGDNDSYPRLVQGPMLGALGPDEATIWTRVNGKYPVEIEIDTDRRFKNPIIASQMLAKPKHDFVTVHKIRGLKSGQTYYYRVKVNHGDHLGAWARLVPDMAYMPPFKLKTAPALGKKTRFRMAFGSCARLQADARQQIWDAVALWEPDLFFWLGDNVYSDSESPVILAGQYRQQRSVVSLQKILRSVPQLAIWDDHDYGRNNHDRTNPMKKASLDVFRHYWANPSYGLPGTPGVFFSYHYGGVDFFCLDGRYYRDPDKDTDTADKTMLGSAQKAWLKDQLAKSNAPFKVLISGSGWSSAGGPGDDSWSGFMTERNELFDYIRDHDITGVFLLSGDTHVGEINAIPWSEQGGYDFYDLVSSPLAQNTSQEYLCQQPEVRMRTPYSGSTNFGIIDFDLTSGVPSLEFKLVNVQGGAVWEPLVLRADELVNGARTWESKIDSNGVKKWQCEE